MPIDNDDIVELATAPKRTTTEEGTVEERSIREQIEADQYTSDKAAKALGVPWGMRIARSKTGSPLD